MRPIRNRTRVTALGATAAVALALPMALTSGANAAGTPKLNGDWSPFTRCPVENPAMLAADGNKTVDVCVTSDSVKSVVKLGSVSLTSGDSNIQFGLVGSFSGGFKVVSPAGGAVSAAPVNVPGGLLGLMCPSSIPVISQICNEVVNSPLNAVTATIESAGNPSKFDFSAGISAKAPIVSVPVKVQLSNPLLGSGCFIGSNSNPIVLRVENTVQPNVKDEFFDANGTPDPNGALTAIYDTSTVNNTPVSQSDTTFAVPGASGCGLLGILDGAVDLKEGIPAATGNSIVREVTRTHLGGLADPAAAAPNSGKTLAADWNSAIVNP